jgi:hypothetical protein
MRYLLLLVIHVADTMSPMVHYHLQVPYLRCWA